MTRQFKDIAFKGFSVGTARISESDFDLPYDATFQALDSGDIKIDEGRLSAENGMNIDTQLTLRYIC
jgi:hypothetical protein